MVRIGNYSSPFVKFVPSDHFSYSGCPLGLMNYLIKGVFMKRFFFESTKRCGIVVESDSVPLEGSHFHRFAQKIGTADLVEIVFSSKRLAFSNSAWHLIDFSVPWLISELILAWMLTNPAEMNEDVNLVEPNLYPVRKPHCLQRG